MEIKYSSLIFSETLEISLFLLACLMYSHCGTLKFNYLLLFLLNMGIVIHLLQRNKATIYSCVWVNIEPLFHFLREIWNPNLLLNLLQHLFKLDGRHSSWKKKRFNKCSKQNCFNYFTCCIQRSVERILISQASVDQAFFGLEDRQAGGLSMMSHLNYVIFSWS